MPSPSSGFVATLSLGRLYHYGLPGECVVSSRTFVLSRFLLQHCPCLVPDDRVPCVVQELHGESSLWSRRPGSWTLFLSCWRRPTARCRSPYRFFSADSFRCGIFFRDFLALESDCISTEVSSLLSGQAFVASWQAVVPFHCALISTIISFRLASIREAREPTFSLMNFT
jgi:hypothetical protein